MGGIIDMNSIIDIVKLLCIRLASALLILLIGLWVIKKITKYAERMINKSKLDNTLKPFFVSLINSALKVLLAVSVIIKLGVDGSSLIAVIGAASLAIGLALQGSLSNLAGGILLLIFRPIRVGDFVDIAGKSGTVESIQLFATRLITLDNKVIFIPNAKVSNSDLLNYSLMSTRRVDQFYGVDYNNDIDLVKRVLREEIDKIPEAMQAPEPFVALNEHADSALIFAIRVWVKSEDYWTVHFGLLENIKKRFDEENINIPFPVVDVRLPEKASK